MSIWPFEEQLTPQMEPSWIFRGDADCRWEAKVWDAKKHVERFHLEKPPWARRLVGQPWIGVFAPEQHHKEAQPCQPDHKQTWVDNLWGIDDERFNDMMTMMMMEIMKIEGARVQRPLPMIASVQLSIVWQSFDFFRSRDPSPDTYCPL